VTAIVGIVGDASPAEIGTADRMLARAASRGADAREVVAVGGAVLGVSRHAWECVPWIGGPATVGRAGHVSVVADAAIYYRSELEAALAATGVRPAGQSSAELIAAAYVAWGDACLDRLEGDYAFVLWDAGRRRVLAARDFVGSRSLFYTVVGDRLLLGSTIGSLLAHPQVASELDPMVLAETAAATFASSHETVYRAIVRLGAGECVTREWGAPAQRARFWSPPGFLGEDAPAVPFEEAAEELQRLIVRAAEERLAPDGRTAVFMSGGADSPAVFAGAQEALRLRGAAGRSVYPVSVGFPVGDSGRENEYIQQIADRWRAPVHWVQIGDIHMFDRAGERAAERDEPFAHPFEMFNRMLAREAVRQGSRVGFNGMMGDPLFQQSPVYLADMVRRGRLRSAVREWKGAGGSGTRQFFRWAVHPLLPQQAINRASRLLRGAPLTGRLDRPMPPWIDPPFGRAAMEARELHFRPARRREEESSYEARWQLLYPFFPLVYGAVFEAQREEGLEARSPLADGRIIRFASTRPRVERHLRGDTKLLLRRAMRGLIPDSVLASREGKTGTLGTYIARSIELSYDSLFEPAFTSSVLGRLGLVDERMLRERARESARNLANRDGPWLMYTLFTELWLRSHESAVAASTTNVSPTAHGLLMTSSGTGSNGS
jgi:asparagine synthase (glutamine-hydrolysing)